MTDDTAETERLREVIRILFGNTPYFYGGTHGLQTTALHNLLLTGLVSLVSGGERPVRVLEVGSWLGFTTLTWAHAIDRLSPAGGEVTCVDKWEPYFAKADVDSGVAVYPVMERMSQIGLSYALALHNFATGPERVPIRPLRGSSQDILPSLAGQLFDIVYLDGSHYYADVAADIANAKALVAEGGIICGDDLNAQIGQMDVNRVRSELGRDCIVENYGTFFYHPGVTLAVWENFGPVIPRDTLWAVRKVEGGFAPLDPAIGQVTVPRHFPPQFLEESRRIVKPPGA